MKQLVLALTAALLLTSCKKEQEVLKAISSYTVVNATTDVSNARIYASESNIYWKTLPASDATAQYRFTHFNVFAGHNNIVSVSAADTMRVLFSTNKTEEFKEAGFSTLFLCGDSIGGYGGIFLNNDDINIYNDSVMGIRFINLSPNSSPVSITLSASPTVNEATGLVYKQMTGFKTYPASQSAANMVFQLRDAGGALLATYTLPVTPVTPYTTVGILWARFKNLTLVIKGIQGATSGANAFGIFPVAHY